MGTLKGDWDRLVMPPEEMKRNSNILLYVMLIFALVPLTIGGGGIISHFFIRSDHSLLAFSIFFIAFSILAGSPLFIIFWYVRSKKSHSVSKLHLNRIEVEDFRGLIEVFLKNKRIEYTIERPGNYSYRGYGFPPDIGIFLRDELFLGIDSRLCADNNMRWGLWIYYLPSAWEEAFMLQKELDEYVFEKGFAIPLRENAHLTF